MECCCGHLGAVQIRYPSRTEHELKQSLHVQAEALTSAHAITNSVCEGHCASTLMLAQQAMCPCKVKQIRLCSIVTAVLRYLLRYDNSKLH